MSEKIYNAITLLAAVRAGEFTLEPHSPLGEYILTDKAPGAPTVWKFRSCRKGRITVRPLEPIDVYAARLEYVGQNGSLSFQYVAKRAGQPGREFVLPEFVLENHGKLVAKRTDVNPLPMLEQAAQDLQNAVAHNARAARRDRMAIKHDDVLAVLEYVARHGEDDGCAGAIVDRAKSLMEFITGASPKVFDDRIPTSPKPQAASV